MTMLRDRAQVSLTNVGEKGGANDGSCKGDGKGGGGKPGASA